MLTSCGFWKGKTLSNSSRWSCWPCFLISNPKQVNGLNSAAWKREFSVAWDGICWSLQKVLSHFFCWHGILLCVFLWVGMTSSKWHRNESFGMSPNFTMGSIRHFCGIGAWSSDVSQYLPHWTGPAILRFFLFFFFSMWVFNVNCYRLMLPLLSACSLHHYCTGSPGWLQGHYTLWDLCLYHG